MVSSLKSGILGPGAVFKIQLWNLGSGHPFSGVNSGILGPGTCFQGQLWNLWFGTCFQDSTLESWVRAPVFRSQLWNLGFRTGTSFQESAPVSKVNSGILDWDTRFQESTLEFLVRHLLSGTNSGIMGLGTCFRKRFWFSGISSRNFGGAPVFRSQLWNLGPGDLMLLGVNSGILG